jgi:vacuolar-type H+-ATPase subunit H
MRGWMICSLLAAGLVTAGCETQETAVGAEIPEAAVTASPSPDAAGGVQDAANAAGDSAESVSEALQAEAQKLLDEAMDYIKNNKLEVAEQSVAKLESMQTSLPASMQQAVVQARSALDVAKKASGLPGMPR